MRIPQLGRQSPPALPPACALQPWWRRAPRAAAAAAPDERRAGRVARVDGKVVRAIDLHHHAPVRPLQRNVQAEQAVLRGLRVGLVRTLGPVQGHQRDALTPGRASVLEDQHSRCWARSAAGRARSSAMWHVCRPPTLHKVSSDVALQPV